MASNKQAGDYTEELICPVCLELFNDPVILECGHNFCRSCINRVWDREKQPSCPECREEFPARKYTVNRLLANVIERLKQRPDHGQKEERSDQHCKEHEERMKLFCQEDEALIYALCVPEHPGHSFLTVQKAVDMYKGKLTAALSHLESNLKDRRETQNQQEQKISEATNNARGLEQHITSEFAKLHQFLQDREQKLLQQLKEEEAGILTEMEKNLRQVKEDFNTIQKLMSDIQSELEQQDSLTFLNDIKEITEKLSQSQKEGMESKAKLVTWDLSLGVYKGPLQYSVWKEMISIISPVCHPPPQPEPWKAVPGWRMESTHSVISPLTLDSKTAASCLILSEHLTSVRYGKFIRKLPDYPERFDPCACVLGSEGFTSGRHYWEVKVEDMTTWDVAVARESINRKGKIIASPGNGIWAMSLRNGNKYNVNDSPGKVFSLSLKPQKIGVYLDYEGGQVSFYNADNMSHLYTFTDTFTERLYPFFSPSVNDYGKNGEPLKLFHLKL